MRLSSLILILGYGVSGIVLADTNTSTAFSISYSGSTERIEIRDSRLRFIWFAQRPLVPGQPLYEQHQIEVRLNPKELSALHQWVQRSHLSDFPSSLPRRKGVIRGIACPSQLHVISETSRYSIDWADDCEVPADLTSALTELVNICRDIEKEHKDAK